MVGSRKKKDLITLVVVFTALVLINYLSGYVFTRVDFTKEKRYTLSPVSKLLLDGLPQQVKVTVYLEGSDLPPGFKRLQRATRDMLVDLQAYSHGGSIQYEFINPLAGIAQQQQNDVIKELQA
jgi:ABC-2 type transport system permease protein